MNRQELGAWLGMTPEWVDPLHLDIVAGMADVPVPTTDEEQRSALRRLMALWQALHAPKKAGEQQKRRQTDAPNELDRDDPL